MTAPATSAFSEYLFFIQFGPAVLRSVAILVIITGDETGSIVYASELLHSMFGYADKELVGRRLDCLLRMEDQMPHCQHLKDFARDPYTRSMNAGVWVDAVKKDGTPFKVQVSLCRQTISSMDCVVACVADVTKSFEHMRPDPFHH